MDTIDVSNLNRQFLFRKKHVGQPKCVIAKESALRICPDAEITAHFGNVKSPEFGPDFIKQFDVVLNALDNLDARRHMNRLCLAAKIPLVESGSAGYLGQVQTIFAGETECFECQPKVAPKLYPYCTIHATPSQSIHNVIWSKEYLFRILFGPPVDEDDEEDETAVQARQQKLPESLLQEAKHEESVSFGRLQFHKAFTENIYRLLQLEALWEDRKKPLQLSFVELEAKTDKVEQGAEASLLQDQRKLTLAETAKLFVDACNQLQERKLQVGSLDFDKDDDDALNFVTAAANLRSHCYGIEQLSRFDIKQKAGNIIPAIATANAIVAGLIVVEAIKIIRGNKDDCRFTYLYKEPNSVGRFLSAIKLDAPNPNCFVCSSEFVQISVTDSMTLGEFNELVLAGHLKLSRPSILFGESYLYEPPFEDEEDEFAGQLVKPLKQFGMTTGSTLEVNDQLSDLTVSLSLRFVDSVSSGEKWALASDETDAEKKQEEEEGAEPLTKKAKN